MTTSRFTKLWYTTLACLLLVACAGLILGSRDTKYIGNRDAYILNTNVEQSGWWAATVLLRLPNGKQWCSAVCINNVDMDSSSKQPISWLVTARHCSSSMLNGTASVVYYNPNGSLMREDKYKVIYVLEHKTKDFAVLKVTGHIPFQTNVYTGRIPVSRQDYICGFRGDKYNDFYKFGKFLNPAWADKGQSGGGVFATGFGLHAIVSTHTDGVNVYRALVDMKLESLLQNE